MLLLTAQPRGSRFLCWLTPLKAAVEVCTRKSEKSSFQVVLIPLLEGVVVQTGLEQFGCPDLRVYNYRAGSDPPERNLITMQTQNIT